MGLGPATPWTNGHVWQYTPTVITRDTVYATFTEDTNKTTLPIMLAVPPRRRGGLHPGNDEQHQHV